MMNFHEYMWSLAHEPFKKSKNPNNDISKLLHTFGEVLEDVKNNIFLIRRQALIKTSQGKALDGHGGSKFPRYSEEYDEQYRNRLLNRKEQARKAGTVEGMLLALQSLGYINAEINPFYTLDPERWAEFYIMIDKLLLNKLNNFEAINQEIMKTKTSSSYPNYAFTYYDKLIFRTSNIWGFSDMSLRICGTFCIGKHNSPIRGYTLSKEKILSDFAIALQTYKVCSKTTKCDDEIFISGYSMPKTKISCSNSIVVKTYKTCGPNLHCKEDLRI